MKKFSSMLTLITAAALVCPVSACAKGTANQELSALTKEAYELGADTDYFGIASYKYSYNRPVPYDVYNDFIERFKPAREVSFLSFITGVLNKDNFNMGMSILNVLAHNGVIKPSDIYENAKNMADIKYSESVGRIITNYESITGMPEFANYTSYLKGLEHSEQIDRLLAMAEKSESEGRYFLISYNYAGLDNDRNYTVLTNAVTGIGIADVDWSFRNTSFDKCILVLDPNSVTAGGLAGGFDEAYCIYINSETKECYIPAYNIGGNTNYDIVFASVDDDTFFNYRGPINPYDTIATDFSHLVELSNTSDKLNEQRYYTYNGAEVPYNVSTDERKNSLTSKVVLADSVRLVATGSEWPRLSYISANRLSNVSIHNLYTFADASISENEITVKNISYTDDVPEGYGHEPQEYEIEMYMKDGTHSFAPYTDLYMWGMTDTEISCEFTDEGLILRSPERIYGKVSLFYHTYDETGDMQYHEISSPHINSMSDVLLKIDDNEQIEVLYDIDSDGIFSEKVQKGDVNADGVVDAADASEILAHYAANATAWGAGDQHFMTSVNNEIGDINGDGSVDAVDASLVLSIYGENATS